MVTRTTNQLRFFVSGESSHFQPIIDSVNQWILTIQNNKKIAQLSQSQVESIELNGIQNQNILRDKKKRQLIAFLARVVVKMIKSMTIEQLIYCYVWKCQS